MSLVLKKDKNKCNFFIFQEIRTKETYTNIAAISVHKTPFKNIFYNTK